MPERYFAKDQSELLNPQDLATMSGLEFIEGIAAGRLPAPPISRLLNFWMAEVRSGEVVFMGEPTFDAMNPIGSVHGGWFGTILDSCMACAYQTTLPKGMGYTTLEFKINIVRPILPGRGQYRAVGTVDHAGRRTGVVHGQLTGADDGKLYATGSTTCMALPLEPAS